MSLWEGARRLPYFYTYPVEECGADGLGVTIRPYVVCPQCALEHVQDEKLEPHFTTIRSVMCCRCGIVMGPINKAEMEADGE